MTCTVLTCSPCILGNTVLTDQALVIQKSPSLQRWVTGLKVTTFSREGNCWLNRSQKKTK